MTDREALGRLVRQIWTDWAREQRDPKASWLTPWEELDAGQREVDMRIGEAVALAEREQIYAELGNDHYVIFTENGWTVEHSMECRLSGHMHECPHHEAVSLVADLPMPSMLGRWRIAGIDSAGLPILSPAYLTGEHGD